MAKPVVNSKKRASAERRSRSEQRVVSRRMRGKYIGIARTLKMYGHWIEDWLDGRSDNPPMVMYLEKTSQDYERLRREPANDELRRAGKDEQ